MKIIQESAEHHFLTVLEKLRRDAGGWLGFHYGLSKKLPHDAIIENPLQIKARLQKAQQEALLFVAQLKAHDDVLRQAIVYLFADNDIIMFIQPDNDRHKQDILALHARWAHELGARFASAHYVAKDIYNIQKIADKRLLAEKRVTAYNAMADINRLASIPLRRQRYEDGMVLVVEDDRFTASYASNILNKDYDLVHVRTGEEALCAYIDHAPHIVFLDIHLPGLSGHETLRAVRRIDPDAHVIMLSVDTARDNVITATRDGAAGFIKKPFTRDRMLNIVRQSPLLK